MRVVLDTNVLIDGERDAFSAQARLIDAACNGELTALSTPAIEREYNKLLRRLVMDEEYREHLGDFIAATELVTEERMDITLDDMEDLKFLKAAAGGAADLLVTNDRHLLDIGEVGPTRIVRPAEAWAAVAEEQGGMGEWESWAKGLGIGNS